MQRYFSGLIAAAAVLAGYNPAVAEDIDLFVQPPGIATGAPNVLIILDNTANWNDPFTEQMAALVDTFNGLDVDENGNPKFRVGLMLFTESGGANKGEDGGYVRAAIRDMDTAEPGQVCGPGRQLRQERGQRRTRSRPARRMADAYQYFSGLPPLTGNQKSKTDYKGNVVRHVRSASKAIWPCRAMPWPASTRRRTRVRS